MRVNIHYGMVADDLHIVPFLPKRRIVHTHRILRPNGLMGGTRAKREATNRNYRAKKNFIHIRWESTLPEGIYDEGEVVCKNLVSVGDGWSGRWSGVRLGSRIWLLVAWQRGCLRLPRRFSQSDLPPIADTGNLVALPASLPSLQLGNEAGWPAG